MPEYGNAASENRETHDLVICTKNRPGDVAAALDTVSAQELVPTRLIIVDSSDTAETENLLRQQTFAFPVTYVRSLPGLTRQRNEGVREASSEIIHFIDDDVLLSPQYLREIMNSFAVGGSRTVGVGGLIRFDESRRPRIWWRAALLDSKRQGVVLPSGVNVIVTAIDNELEVQWLSGCSMSYRTAVFESEEFDEDLKGYGLMEDLDFSYAVRRQGRLVVTPKAGLVHNVSQVERWGNKERVRTAISRRGWFVRKHMRVKNLCAFVYSVISGAFIHAIFGLMTLSRFRVRVAVWQLQGLLQFFRGQR